MARLECVYRFHWRQTQRKKNAENENFPLIVARRGIASDSMYRSHLHVAIYALWDRNGVFGWFQTQIDRNDNYGSRLNERKPKWTVEKICIFYL